MTVPKESNKLSCLFGCDSSLEIIVPFDSEHIDDLSAEAHFTRGEQLGACPRATRQVINNKKKLFKRTALECPIDLSERQKQMSQP